ncbi:hypothetical protein NFI96_009023 [Prochilodus magdalenae]|nr:hypothetical protein NFI96_009023 [Prochilodus magdalenae]
MPLCIGLCVGNLVIRYASRYRGSDPVSKKTTECPVWSVELIDWTTSWSHKRSIGDKSGNRAGQGSVVAWPCHVWASIILLRNAGCKSSLESYDCGHSVSSDASMSHPVGASTIGRRLHHIGLHARRPLRQRHQRCHAAVPDCHRVTQNGSGPSSVTSPTFVLVEMTNESVCGGTVVRAKMNGVSVKELLKTFGRLVTITTNSILNFLTDRRQVVKLAGITSSSLTRSTGAPQGCVLSPLLYFLYTHDCTARHSSNVIIKFADDTAIVGLISKNNEEAYREEVSFLTHWCRENNLSLSVNKTKELIVDFRKQERVHTPITINGAAVERVSSFRFLGVHITEELTWTEHTTRVVKKAQQRLFFLRRLRRFGMDPRILRTFYTCTVESILTGSITTWYGSCTAIERKALQRVVRTAQYITGFSFQTSWIYTPAAA